MKFFAEKLVILREKTTTLKESKLERKRGREEGVERGWRIDRRYNEGAEERVCVYVCV